MVSALAIYNLDSPGLIARVYRTSFPAAARGCVFNLDIIFPVGPAWLTCTGATPAATPPSKSYVAPGGLEEKLRYLRAVGFAEADCVWKDLDEGLLWA